LTLNNVNVYSSTPRRNFLWKANIGGTHAQTYTGIVNLYSDVFFETSGAPGTPYHTSIINELNFYPGYTYFADRTSNTLSTGATAGFKFNITNELNANYIDCNNPIFWNYLAFLMNPGATVDVDGVNSTDILASGPSAPYSLGSNSNPGGGYTGWSAIPPAPRTLVWVGPYESNGNW